MAQNMFASLQKWDVEFDIGPEMLGSILNYMVNFRNELYIKLFENRIFIQSKGMDGTQYTDIDINAEGVQNYTPNIPKGLEERYKTFTRDEQIQYRNIYVTPEGVHKRVFLNLIDKSPSTPINELLMFLGKSPVRIRIDTLIDKRIEFTTQRGMYIWWRLMDPVCDENKKAENMPAIIAKIRNNTSVPKAILTMEPGLFKRVASLGGKLGKTGSAHTRALFETDVNKGLSIASGDNLRGRILKLGVLGSNLSGYDNLGNKIAGSYDEVVAASEQPFASKDTSIDVNTDTDENADSSADNFSDDDEEYNNQTLNDIDNIGGMDNIDNIENDAFTNSVVDEVPFASPADISGRSKKNKEKSVKKSVGEFEEDLRKKEKKKGNKEDETVIDEAITNDLSSAEVEVKTQLWLEIPYLSPLLKLGGMSPIFIEMRNGMPLVVIQRPYPDMQVLLTVAPRIETDDDTD